MTRIALIGGTGSAALLAGRGVDQVSAPATPWGTPSGAFARWRQGGTEVWFLPRHGEPAAIPPHRVNYRANIWAVRELAPRAVIGINAVGGITAQATPGRLVLPAQLIDYTWGRGHSFCDAEDAPLRHVEFDPPFDEALRAALATAAAGAGLDAVDGGTYGCTQGPRLETAAEIDRLAADGCDIVGMTAMPEAALAREAGLAYAICAGVVNRAAGRLQPGASIHGDIEAHVATAIAGVRRLLDALLAAA